MVHAYYRLVLILGDIGYQSQQLFYKCCKGRLPMQRLSYSDMKVEHGSFDITLFPCSEYEYCCSN